MLLRCLAIQGSWNYEILVGNGVGFCVEPALRQLPGGLDGQPYKAALARQSVYFNAHPYLAALAVGALARAEVEQVAPVRIERFRTALCGPLGSVGDRLVWAAWLPACSLVAILLFGFGWSPLGVVLGFLFLYNVGHLGLRDWGLRNGWKHGLRVATALGHPVLQHGHATLVGYPRCWAASRCRWRSTGPSAGSRHCLPFPWGWPSLRPCLRYSSCDCRAAPRDGASFCSCSRPSSSTRWCVDG